MSYVALYRKFRPDTFEEVKGQEHIVKTLKNQIRKDRIGHAYLFCGTRGTGKTSVAKILAKAVNCEHPIDGSPCNECPTCKAIAAGVSMDNVIEIDAASNNGVDNIREIREEVAYRPTRGRFKVYIIDEVHMLSQGAFNALLKTLEEPPEYVIFVLATTEVNKIPITILSRCQRYDFRRIDLDTIALRLSDLLKREGVEAEDKALRYVAKAGDGSMRDALSLLDQCIAFHIDEILTYEKVLQVLGASDYETFSGMLRDVLNEDVPTVTRRLEELIVSGKELTQFVGDFTWYLRNLLLLKTDQKQGEALDVSRENLRLLTEECQLVETETLMRYIRILSELSNTIRYSSQKRVLVEVALIKMCRPEMEVDVTSILERVRVLEKKLADGAYTVALPAERGPGAEGSRPSPAAEKPRTEEQPKAYEKAAPADLQAVVDHWGQILEGCGGFLRNTLAQYGTPKFNPDTEDNTLYLVISTQFSGIRLSDRRIAELKENVERIIHKAIDIKIITEGDTKGNLQQLKVRDQLEAQIDFPVTVEEPDL